MSYEQVASISQVAALLFFFALFVGIVVYAFWPGNKKKFEEAAKLPFEQDPEPKNEIEKDG
jgi:cytochrome c oxidase cbb3-type subunit 4